MVFLDPCQLPLLSSFQCSFSFLFERAENRLRAKLLLRVSPDPSQLPLSVLPLLIRAAHYLRTFPFGNKPGGDLRKIPAVPALRIWKRSMCVPFQLDLTAARYDDETLSGFPEAAFWDRPFKSEGLQKD